MRRPVRRSSSASPGASFRLRPTHDDGPVSGIGEAVVFLALVAVLAVVAVRLGMLLAPRLDRLTTPDDEDDGGRPD
jgi:hypothetical protein